MGEALTRLTRCLYGRERINTYKYVRIVELEEQKSTDLTERQGNRGSTNEPDASLTVLREGRSDTQGPNEQPRDVTLLQGDTARFEWRVDLKDNSYKYDSLVKPVGHTEQREGRHTATRNLRCWSDDDIDGPGQTPRESTPWRGLTDSPVSQHNLWYSKEVRQQCDTPVGAYDGGANSCVTHRRECMMGG